MLTSLLKLTKNGATSIESINIDAKLTNETSAFLLSKLQSEELVNLEGESVKVNTESRLKLAVKVVQLGADLERISDLLAWQEFETMASLAMEFNWYTTVKNLHFAFEKKRWEIDVVGWKKPLVVCVDCKQWHHGLRQSSLRRISEMQSARTEQFAQAMPGKTVNCSFTKWEKALFVPVVLSLFDSSVKFCDSIPVVPVLKLQDFIHQLALNLDCVKTFARKFTHL